MKYKLAMLIWVLSVSVSYAQIMHSQSIHQRVNQEALNKIRSGHLANSQNANAGAITTINSDLNTVKGAMEQNTVSITETGDKLNLLVERLKEFCKHAGVDQSACGVFDLERENLGCYSNSILASYDVVGNLPKAAPLGTTTTISCEDDDRASDMYKCRVKCTAGGWKLLSATRVHCLALNPGEFVFRHIDDKTGLDDYFDVYVKSKSADGQNGNSKSVTVYKKNLRTGSLGTPYSRTLYCRKNESSAGYSWHVRLYEKEEKTSMSRDRDGDRRTSCERNYRFRQMGESCYIDDSGCDKDVKPMVHSKCKL